MVSQRVFLAIALGVIALGGCKGSKPPAAAPEAGKIAANPPSRTPGLWRLADSMDGQVGTSTICLDPEVDKKLTWWGAPQSDTCDTSLEEAPDGSWRFSSTCKAANSESAIVRTGSARGDFKTSYSLEGSVSITGSPDPNLNGVKSFSESATFVGECPSDMPPGTMEIQGRKIDVLNLGQAQ